MRPFADSVLLELRTLSLGQNDHLDPVRFEVAVSTEKGDSIFLSCYL